ncbi:MAG: DUF368 domain-containing protein [Candidatus Kapabacteria bacterium]|nr:DUF368 domain-containing protein [Candidatus Kapabacteria bacterium]
MSKEKELVEQKANNRKLKDYIRIFGVGVAMGSADIVPGVSGGTMAFILGIYEELLTTIKSFNIKFLKLLFSFKIKEALEHVNYKFLISLLLGLGGALLSLAHIISWLLENEPVLIFSFFFGLVLASIVSVSSHVRWNIPMIITFIVGTAIAYFTVRLMPMNMPNDPLTLFWTASVAIMAMILPGISGSFILFILGQYKFILDAVKSFDIITLLPVAAGILVGIMTFSRILTWLLKHHKNITITLLVGFMMGSLWKIWPFRIVLETATKPNGDIIPIKETVILPDISSGIFWIALFLCIIGVILISIIDHLESKNNPIIKIFINNKAKK